MSTDKASQSSGTDPNLDGHIRNKISDEFISRNHRFAVECLHCGEETIAQGRVSLESGLETIQKQTSVPSFRPPLAAQTDILAQELVQNSHELIVDELRAFESRLLDATNLLLDNDFESSRANEQSRRGT